MELYTFEVGLLTGIHSRMNIAIVLKKVFLPLNNFFVVNISIQMFS